MATTYSLQLDIAANDLATIVEAGENIVLAKVFSDSPSNIAWISLPPLSHNRIEWLDEYAVYYATQSGGVNFIQTSALGIPSGTYFTLTSKGLDGPKTGSEAPPQGSYRAINQTSSTQTLGLAQAVGGGNTSSPIVATAVPQSQLATWTPLPAVYVWLATGISTGATITVPPSAQGAGAESRAISSRSTRIDFQKSNSVHCLYDAAKGAFVEQAS